MFRTLTQQVLRTATLAVVVGMAGCASLPQPHDDGALQREAMAGTRNPVPAPLPLNNDISSDSATAAKTEVSHGSGQFIRPGALSTP
ncbi:MAG: type II secretion system protein GspD, partial [Rhodanobacter sp.]